MELKVIKNSAGNERKVWFDKNYIVSPVHNILRREKDRKTVTTQHLCRSNNICIETTMLGEKSLRSLPRDDLIFDVAADNVFNRSNQSSNHVTITSKTDASFLVVAAMYVTHPAGYTSPEVVKDNLLDLQPALFNFLLFNNAGQENPEALPKGYGWDGVSGITERLRVQKTKQLIIGDGTWDIPRALIIELSEMALFTPTQPKYITMDWAEAKKLDYRNTLVMPPPQNEHEETHVFMQKNDHSVWLGRNIKILPLELDACYIILKKNIINNNGRIYGISTDLIIPEVTS